MDKLHFLTAGQPLSTDGAGYERAFQILDELKLDGMELEFVHGIRISEKSKNQVKNASKNKVLTAHAPFYINLNAKEPEKIESSIKYITDTAELTKELGGYSITYHAAYYMGKDKEKVYETVKSATQRIIDNLEMSNNDIWVRPETTGKGTQWGDLDEVIKLSNDFEQVLPCIDFSHLHARSIGLFNTYDEFCRIFERIGTEIGDYALENFHAHAAGIEYGDKGERKHLIFEESDMNYKDLLKAFKKFDVKGVLVCESPNIEGDAQLLKAYYESL